MARAVISIAGFCARPATTEPMTKTIRAIWTRAFLLKRSASLPHRGVEAVIVSSEAVTTQV